MVNYNNIIHFQESSLMLQPVFSLKNTNINTCSKQDYTLSSTTLLGYNTKISINDRVYTLFNRQIKADEFLQDEYNAKGIEQSESQNQSQEDLLINDDNLKNRKGLKSISEQLVVYVLPNKEVHKISEIRLRSLAYWYSSWSPIYQDRNNKYVCRACNVACVKRSSAFNHLHLHWFLRNSKLQSHFSSRLDISDKRDCDWCLQTMINGNLKRHQRESCIARNQIHTLESTLNYVKERHPKMFVITINNEEFIDFYVYNNPKEALTYAKNKNYIIDVYVGGQLCYVQGNRFFSINQLLATGQDNDTEYREENEEIEGQTQSNENDL